MSKVVLAFLGTVRGYPLGLLGMSQVVSTFGGLSGLGF